MIDLTVEKGNKLCEQKNRKLNRKKSWLHSTRIYAISIHFVF